MLKSLLVKPLEQVLPREERDRLRREALAAEPRFYSPWLHVTLPSLVGLLACGAALSQVRHLRAVDGLFFLGILLLSNAVEWRAHRDLLHKRVRPLGVLYDRHTPQHHMIFVHGDMALRSPREFRLVLIPVTGVLAIFLVTAVPAAVLWSFDQKNFGALYLTATLLYVISYELMHLAWHMPDDSFIGSLRLVRALREHHSVHHDPRLMQRWNFNVTVPLWDLVRRTYFRSASSERAEA